MEQEFFFFFFFYKATKRSPEGVFQTEVNIRVGVIGNKQKGKNQSSWGKSVRKKRASGAPGL